MNRHMKALRMITNMGKDDGSKKIKLARATMNQDCGPCLMYVIWKDHKPNLEEKLPTRPVCDGNVGPLMRLSDIHVRILNAVVEGDVKRVDSCKSTEEMLGKLEDCVLELINESNVIKKEYALFSIDVKAHYPSLNYDDVLECIER